VTEAGRINNELMVSIIVPVFNVVSYIKESLHSLTNQEFTEAYEIILVDDASTDASLKVCRQFAVDHADKIRLLENQTNTGVSIARNLGLEQARGRYLMFVDADDILPPRALASLFDAVEKNNADIAKGNLVLFDSNSRRPAPDHIRAGKVISGEDVLTTLFAHSEVRGHAGGKIFRRDKFGQVRFTTGVRMTEDLLYFSEIFAAAESLVLLETEVYEYRKHPAGSTGSKYETGSYIDWLGAVEKCGEFASTARQKRAHKDLLLRSMTQIARECRKISGASAMPVLDLMEKKRRQWNLRFFPLVARDRLGLRSLSRYIKLRLALKQVRNNLS